MESGKEKALGQSTTPETRLLQGVPVWLAKYSLATGIAICLSAIAGLCVLDWTMEKTYAINFDVKVLPDSTRMIRSYHSGVIRRLNVQTGDYVGRGDVLAVYTRVQREAQDGNTLSSSDTAEVRILSPFEGVVVSIPERRAAGATLKLGEPLIELRETRPKTVSLITTDESARNLRSGELISVSNEENHRLLLRGIISSVAFCPDGGDPQQIPRGWKIHVALRIDSLSIVPYATRMLSLQCKAHVSRVIRLRSILERMFQNPNTQGSWQSGQNPVARFLGGRLYDGRRKISTIMTFASDDTMPN